jgi:hypothetical protein
MRNRPPDPAAVPPFGLNERKQRRRHGAADPDHRNQAFEQRAIVLPDAEQRKRSQEGHQPQDDPVTGDPLPTHVTLRRIRAIAILQLYCKLAKELELY